jgi:hypothetical protein
LTDNAFEGARKAVRDAEAAGQASLDIKSVHALLNLLEGQAAGGAQGKPLSERDLEAYKAQLAKWVAENEHVNAWSLESFRQILALGQAVIKAATAINGGAAVALLAFIGHLSTSTSAKFGVPPFAGALRYFVFGVFFAALSAGGMYFSQLAYDGEKSWHKKAGVAFHVLTAVLG